jgi:CheY-like chemotaxis protein
VPIVALTANAFDEDAAHAMAAGMDAHLAKPYSRAQLRELLVRWL